MQRTKAAMAAVVVFIALLRYAMDNLIGLHSRPAYRHASCKQPFHIPPFQIAGNTIPAVITSPLLIKNQGGGNNAVQRQLLRYPVTAPRLPGNENSSIPQCYLYHLFLKPLYYATS